LKAHQHGIVLELLEQRYLLTAFTGNTSIASAAYVGVAPGVHIDGLTLNAGAQAWYEVQVLRAAKIDFDLGFNSSQGVLDLNVRGSQGNLLASGIQNSAGATVDMSLNTSGTYFLEVSGQTTATSNVYNLSADFDSSDGGHVFYVNDASPTNDFYTLAPGNDNNSGTSASAPKSTVQSVLANCNVDPADMIVVDTGTYNDGTINLDSNDQGFVLAGSPGGSVLSYGGTALELSNADQNVIYGLQFSGNSTGIYSQASGVNTSTSNLFENNTFQNDSCAISLNNGGNDTILGNAITGGSEGISLSGWSGSDTISQNTITGSNTAISASYGSAQSTLLIGGSSSSQGNVLSNGSQGISVSYQQQVTVRDNTLSGFSQDAVDVSSAGVIQGNNVSESGTGIAASGGSGLSVFGNTLTNNQIGIAGSAMLGGSDWSSDPDGTPHYNELDGNQTGIEASSGATVAFNRVIGGAIGILVSGSNVTIAHNIVARTTQDAIHVQDASNVTIESDTLYVPPVTGSQTADGVVVDTASSSVSLQNNIIWSQSGYDIYVANDSQQGFASDYNNLFVSGTGKLAWWQTDFLDLYDWQTETLFDTHSIGYTTLAPTLDNPQFVNVAADDYQLTPLISTSIAAGNPASDYSLQNSDTGGRIELGAYGDTSLAAQSRASFIVIDAPNFARDWLATQSNTILWHSFNLPSSDGVWINLLDTNGNFLQCLNRERTGWALVANGGHKGGR
jgi:hypothetical protein